MATREQAMAMLEEAERDGKVNRARVLRERLGLPPKESAPTEVPAELQNTPLQEVGSVISGLPGNAMTGLAEMGSAVGRSMAQGLDFLAPGTANAALRLSGSDYQLPTFEGGYEAASEFAGSPTGGYMQEGLPRDAVRGFGGAAPALLGAAPVAGRNIASPIGATMDLLGFGAAAPRASVSPLALSADPLGMLPPATVTPPPGPLARSAKKTGELIESDPGNVRRAGMELDPYTGLAYKDKASQQALNQEVDSGFVAMVQSASESTKAKMKEMLEAVVRGREHFEERSTTRPLDIAGRSLMDRVDVVKDINRRAGSQLDDVAKSLKGEPIDVSGPINQFINDVESMGVDFGVNEGISLGFKNSDIENLKGPINTLTNMVNRLADTRTPDAYDVHRLKKYIDEVVTYGKSKKGLGGKTERILKGLRRNLDGLLDRQYPAYDKVNTEYSETIEALNELQRLVGKKNDVFGDYGDRVVGTLLRRMESNAQSGPQVLQIADDLDGLAKKYTSGAGRELGPYRGALAGPARPSFDDSVKQQVLFADHLNRLFGTPAGTSFQGEIAKALGKSAEDSMLNPTFAGMVRDTSKSVIDFAKGRNEENAIKAIREMLRQQ